MRCLTFKLTGWRLFASPVGRLVMPRFLQTSLAHECASRDAESGSTSLNIGFFGLAEAHLKNFGSTFGGRQCGSWHLVVVITFNVL